ncbi:MAG: hypothetical protein IJ311_04490 [Elusimicrobiaceae bacterium]|nr:hypothetical protein [Elusimicrobiaceae bacterium]
MRKRIKYCVLMAALAVLSALSGCATGSRSNAPVCRIRFDYQDESLCQLNTHNLRALLSFQQICP